MEATVSYLLMLQKYINSCPLCLYNISKDFALNNIKKETGLKGIVKVFSVDYNSIDTLHDLYL